MLFLRNAITNNELLYFMTPQPFEGISASGMIKFLLKELVNKGS